MYQPSLYNYRAISLFCLYQSVNERKKALEVLLIIGFKQCYIEIDTISIINNNSEHIQSNTQPHSIIDCG